MDEPSLLLLPTPRRITRTSARPVPLSRLVIAGALPENADRALLAVRPYLYGGEERDIANLRLHLTIDPRIARPQGYVLHTAMTGVDLIAHDEAGLFYGVQTLVQLLKRNPRELPFMSIEDWPDFPTRGVMLDVSRDKVPTMKTLFGLIDLLASWKINQVQLYMEHTFAYANHGEVWEHASPFTADEICILDAFCRERFVDLVPNQNSFGHMERVVEARKISAAGRGRRTARKRRGDFAGRGRSASVPPIRNRWSC